MLEVFWITLICCTVRTGCDKGSIYSLGINSAGTLVMTGSTETIVRGWDPRSGQKVFKLKGHADNIKALIMNPEGTLCLTGSSDFTVRLWDIGQQVRCNIAVFILNA